MQRADEPATLAAALCSLDVAVVQIIHGCIPLTRPLEPPRGDYSPFWSLDYLPLALSTWPIRNDSALILLASLLHVLHVQFLYSLISGLNMLSPE